MKVYIGPYVDWFGPYQLAEKILFWKDKDDDAVCDLGEKIDKTFIGKFLAWRHSKQERTVMIKLDKYDSWNAGNTLALIILPVLKQLQDTKHGSPSVDDADVPDDLKSTSVPSIENEWEVDDNHHKRWDWVLAEMIWAFDQYNQDWENQYASGTMDLQFVKKENGMSELVHGPNHTYTIDWKSRDEHYQRIQNGIRLFAKYYDGLWD